MASTNNKNSTAEYNLQTAANKYIDEYPLYKTSTVPVTPLFAGNGLLTARMGRDVLSNNSCDVESFLFGINSTNLVNPKPEYIPQIKQLNSLNIIPRTKLIMPTPVSNANYGTRPLLYDS